MSKSILMYILISVVFLFSLAPIAGAQQVCEFPAPPSGVMFAYKCELNCYQCLEGAPECKACDSLEIVFRNIFNCANGLIDCEEGPVQ